MKSMNRDLDTNAPTPSSTSTVCDNPVKPLAMDIDEYINSGTVKRKKSPIYESALRMAYDYHKGMDKKRLVILWDKARDGDTDSWEGLAICTIISKLLKDILIRKSG